MHNTKHEHLGPYCKRARSSLKWTFSSAVTIDEIIKHEKKNPNQQKHRHQPEPCQNESKPVADFKSAQQIILVP